MSHVRVPPDGSLGDESSGSPESPFIWTRPYVLPRLLGTYIPEKLRADKVEIRMSQHIGAPSVPCVEVGDTVTEGQMIANAGNGLSVPQYASIGGRVTFVDPTRIIIEAQDA